MADDWTRVRYDHPSERVARITRGMYTAIQSAFALHHVAHSNTQINHGMLVDPEGLQAIRDEA